MDFFCYPKFDSPSIFCRLLDKDKGGHFSIKPVTYTSNKQQYLPNSNILTTRFMSQDGVSEITDYMHIPEQSQSTLKKPLLPWLIRTVRVVRGSVQFHLECFPSFNYGLAAHTADILTQDQNEFNEDLQRRMPYSQQQDAHSESSPQRVIFTTDDPGFTTCNQEQLLRMDLRFLSQCGDYACPLIKLNLDHNASELGFKGPGVVSSFTLEESQQVTFIFREVPPPPTSDNDNGSKESTHTRLSHMLYDPPLTMDLMDALFRQTAKFWQTWIGSSTYNGRWRESVMRSALTLKLLTYEPVRSHPLVLMLQTLIVFLLHHYQTGAVVAAPTFGIPEAIGGERNWDYRYVWIRDSSFTIYAFLRLGFTEEARKYLDYIQSRCETLVGYIVKIRKGLMGCHSIERRWIAQYHV